MTPTRQGSFKLFSFAGIEVFLHWSWIIVAVFMIQYRGREYGSALWNAVEYVCLFVIVLLHEFGHALACRQVGGQADQIVLWPLGGVAYVSPPRRPGPTLWSIAAGPLVNLMLVPVFSGLLYLAARLGWADSLPDLYKLLQTLWVMNLVLLVFNLMPVYPLDGGQILQSLLWFVFGQARSLQIASVIGILGVVGLFAFAFFTRSLWTALMAGFILMNCWQGLRYAKLLQQVAAIPRRQDAQCPNCGKPPLLGQHWVCMACQRPFDLFEHHGFCPHCRAQYPATRCAECSQTTPVFAWFGPPNDPT